MPKMSVGAVCVLLVALPGLAHASCWEPRPPQAPSSKPRLPSCLSSYERTGEHTCSDQDLFTYETRVDRYLRDLERYERQIYEFRAEAAEYIECETDRITVSNLR